jgi:F-type H+-transporting ATPase subunit b
MRRRATLLLLLALALTLVTLPAFAVEGEEGEHSGISQETIFKWINFFTVLALAIYFLRERVITFFDATRKEIRSEIDEAQTQKRSAEERIAGVEQKLSQLQSESERLRREASEEMAAQLERIRTSLQQEGERIATMAQAEIESNRRAAGLQLRAYSAQLAVRLAEENLRKQLDAKAHAALFKSFTGQLEGKA